MFKCINNFNLHWFYQLVKYQLRFLEIMFWNVLDCGFIFIECTNHRQRHSNLDRNIYLDKISQNII